LATNEARRNRHKPETGPATGGWPLAAAFRRFTRHPHETLLPGCALNEAVAASHDRQAPYWAAGLGFLLATGVSTTWFDLGAFWRGYVLDMTGPAWTYILLRGRFTRWTANAWTRLFAPTRTLAVIVLACFSIEGAQYVEWYEATFDRWDFVAYVSLLLPVFVADSTTYRRSRR